MDWENKLVKKDKLDSPVVEMTPVVWKGRLILVESWAYGKIEKPFVMPDVPPKPSPEFTHITIRDGETLKIVSRCMEEGNYGGSSAFVCNNTLYVFASRPMKDEAGKPGDIDMSMSVNLTTWSKPRVALAHSFGENMYNASVCYDGKRFIMAYESIGPASPLSPADLKTWVKKTPGWMNPPFRFAASDNLESWTKIPNVIYGTDRYTGCPAIRYVGNYYYMLYLAKPYSKWWYETWLTRSKDLIRWKDAPRNPVIAPDPSQDVYFPRSDSVKGDKECNASDADLVEWQGKTRVYFTGGNQNLAGNLQYAEFDGTMQEFFESYYM